jgi:DNA invertase Pin-like site-specific DNA recombinase
VGGSPIITFPSLGDTVICVGIIAGYVRISLDTDESTSVEAQTAILERWAAAQDQPIELYIDRGISGSKAVLRPQFERLRLDIKSGLVDKVVVKSADRLSRNLRRFVEFADEAKNHNTTIHAVEQGIDTGTAVGVLMLQLLSTFAEFEAAQTAQRVKTSIAHRKTLGRSVSMPPLGFRSVTRDGGQYLEIDPEHAPTIRAFANALIAGGSVHAVAKDLNSRGLLPKSGKKWTSASLGKVARNPQIVGMTKSGDDVIRDGAGLPRIEAHLQIIDLEDWQKLQSALSERASNRPQGLAKERQLLHGLASCASCGRLLTRDKSRQGSRYRCTGARHQTRTCTSPAGIQEDILDDYIVAHIQPMLDTPAVTLERTQDPIALQKRLLFDAEIEALSSSLGSLPSQDIPEAAVRLAKLVDDRDAVEVVEVVTKTESGQTLREMFDDDPRKVLAMMMEQISVKKGHFALTEKVQIIWHEDTENYDD